MRRSGGSRARTIRQNRWRSLGRLGQPWAALDTLIKPSATSPKPPPIFKLRVILIQDRFERLKFKIKTNSNARGSKASTSPKSGLATQKCETFVKIWSGGAANTSGGARGGREAVGKSKFWGRIQTKSAKTRLLGGHEGVD